MGSERSSNKSRWAGLLIPLRTFSIDLTAVTQTVEFHHEHNEYHYYVESFKVDAAYQAAFAVKPPVKDLVRWQFTSAGGKLL